MKLHLPLPLLRNLMRSRKTVARTIIGIGALLVIPAAEFSMNLMSAERLNVDKELEACIQKHTLYHAWGNQEFSSEGLVLDAFEEAGKEEAKERDEQELSYTLGTRTLADMTLFNVLGYGSGQGVVGMQVPDPTAPRKEDGTLKLYRGLLITAGIAPLQNYVAHGGAAPSSSNRSESSSTSSPSSTVKAPPAAPLATPKRRSALRRVAAATSYATISLEDEELSTTGTTTVAVDETEGALDWTGYASSSWDTSTYNWLNGTAQTAFSTNSSVHFDTNAYRKEVSVDSNLTLANMYVTAGGYTFTGSGELTINGKLSVTADGNTTFGANNSITAETVELASEKNTTTTFNSSISTTGDFSIDNGVIDPAYAGNYALNGSVNVTGKATINLGTAGTSDATTQLLEANGAFSANTLTLSGSAMKDFNSSVTTSGDLTIYGSSATNDNTTDTHDGATTFEGAVSIGGNLVIDKNGSASFGNYSSLSFTNGGSILLGDGTLSYNRFTQSSVSDLGNITLTDNGARIDVGSLTRVSASISSEAGAAYNLSIGSMPRQFDATLTRISDLNIMGGTVTVTEASSEQLSGSISISGNSNLTLAADNVFAESATGDITITNGVLYLGSTAQRLPGSIQMAGAIVSGGTISPTGNDSTITYTSAGNVLDTTLALGSNHFTISSTEKGSSLSITGDITGDNVGSLSFSGSGAVSLDSALSYTGSVTVGSGTTLDLVHGEALLNASGVTVSDGGILNVTHGGTTTTLNGAMSITSGTTTMAGGLILEDGARLNFSDINGHADTAALTLGSGKLLFGGDITFSFNQSDGSSIENLVTYTLVASQGGIDQKPGTLAGGVTVYANGKETPLGADQYEFGYMKVGETRYFTVTFLAGKGWTGADETTTTVDGVMRGNWFETDANGNYTNWSEGVRGDTALFRTQSTANAVEISFGNVSQTKALYMDGTTDYTIAATSDMVGVSAFQPKETEDGSKQYTTLTKKGSADMTWNGITATMGNVMVEQGSFTLGSGTTLTSQGTITVKDLVYALPASGSTEDASLNNSAKLIIQSGAELKQGASTIKAYGTADAVLHGVTISGVSQTVATSGSSTATFATISGYSAGLTGDSTTPSTHTISNAALKGFSVDHVTFTGTGSMESVTINGGISIGSGGAYTLGGDMAILSQIANEGTITVTSSSLIGVGRLDSNYVEKSANGLTTTYTPFSGGTYVGWDSKTLSAANFRIRGTTLSNIKDISVDVSTPGQLTVSSSLVKFLSWDSLYSNSSWDTPTVGLIVSNAGTSNDFTVASGNTYQYSERLNDAETGDEYIYVADIAADTGAAGISLLGGNKDTATASQSNKLTLWIYDEGSVYGKYVAGVGVFNGTGGTFTGESHLQLERTSQANAVVIGGSQNTIQIGNSYTTISSGAYSEVAGGNYRQTSVGSMATTYKQGSNNLHITGGTFTTVYGGSYETYTDNASAAADARTSYMMVEGGTIGTIYGGDYTTSSSTHTGNIDIELKGGTITNVYAAGGDGNLSQVTGNIHVSLFADAKGDMATTFATGAILDGGSGSLSSTESYHSGLAFDAGGSYDLSSVIIRNFTHLEMGDAASVKANLSNFNTNHGNLVISGPGVLTLTGSDNRPTDEHLYVQEGATLKLEVTSYGDYTHSPTLHPGIHVADASTLDITGYPTTENGGNLSMRLYMEGHGADGKGALYKGNSEMGDVNSKVSLASITLTGDASVRAGNDDAGSSAIYMIPSGNNSFASTLTLVDGTLSADHRGYVLTKVGNGTFGMHNTDVTGGTINVAEGTLFTNYTSDARNTDLILQTGTKLKFGDGKGNDPDTVEGTGATVTATAYNSFAVETLSGDGRVVMSGNGTSRLSISTDQSFENFADSFLSNSSAYYNDKGYTYAVYSGVIEGAGQVIKEGSGTQTFSGSSSTYTGDTIVKGGILYLAGTSTATDFAQAEWVTLGETKELTAATKIQEGVVGTGHLQWQGGKVYLMNGAHIYNSSASATNTGTVIIGVGADVQDDGSITSYHEATYSGVIASSGAMHKEGLGTLNLDQSGRLENGIELTAGTINLYGWADADISTISQTAGSTIKLSYDGSYGAGETEEIGANMAISGTGDARWKQEETTGKATAALISDVGSTVDFTISGSILGTGNVLHSGGGTLVLSGANSNYTGGTIVTDGTLRVASDTGLGATASGGTANLVLREGTYLEVAGGAKTILAATKTEASGTHEGYDGNDIRGTVTIGSDAEGAAEAQLSMQGSGYYAPRTELWSNGTLVFCGENASTTAGLLAGSGTVVVSDAAGTGKTKVTFSSADSLAGNGDFTGSLVVEGDEAQLNLSAMSFLIGSIKVSGNGATVETSGSYVNIGNGNSLEMRSKGDTHADAASVATLKTGLIEIASTGKLSTAFEATKYEYNTAGLAQNTQWTPSEALQLTESNTALDYSYTNGLGEEINCVVRFQNDLAVNVQSSARLESAGGVVMYGGATYKSVASNISLGTLDNSGNLKGGNLTLVLDGGKIKLTGTSSASNGESLSSFLNTALLIGADNPDSMLGQWVLFTDVSEFTVLLSSTAVSDWDDELGGSTSNVITSGNTNYIGKASEVFTNDGAEIADNVALMYDATAGVVFLARMPNYIPEPTTATLSLLGLAALAARRRPRK